MVINSDSNNSVFQPDPYYSEIHATFGDRLSAAREAAGLTQKILASKMGVKLKTVLAWESDSVEPRANKLQMVSALLNVSMVWLMSGLGTGISPPSEFPAQFEKDTMEILNELRSIRTEGETLVKKMKLLDVKISKVLNVYGR